MTRKASLNVSTAACACTVLRNALTLAWLCCCNALKLPWPDWSMIRL